MSTKLNTSWNNYVGKEISKARSLLTKHLIARTPVQKLDENKEPFVVDFLTTTQSIIFKDQATRQSFNLELSLLIKDARVPLIINNQWFTNLLIAHINQLKRLDNLENFGQEPLTFYKFILEILDNVKETEPTYLTTQNWIYITRDLGKIKELKAKVLFFHDYEEFIDDYVAPTIQKLWTPKFLLFQKVLGYFSKDTLDIRFFDILLMAVFKLNSKSVNESTLRFFTKVLPIIDAKIGHLEYDEALIFEWLEFWEESTLDEEQFCKNVKFLSAYFTFHFSRIRKTSKQTVHSEVLEHLLNGQNIRSFDTNHAYFTKKMAHLFHNFEDKQFLSLRKIYEKVIFQSIGLEKSVYPIFEEFRFPLYTHFGLSKDRLLQFQNIIKKLGSLNITSWDKEETWMILGFISHHLRVTPDFSITPMTLQTLRRRVETYYRELQLAKAAEKQWQGYDFSEAVFERNGKKYRLVQILDSKDLQKEGSILSHCVYLYKNKCINNTTSIWSLRETKLGLLHPLVTIEVVQRTIHQVYAKYNSRPADLYLEMIKEWREANGINCDNSSCL